MTAEAPEVTFAIPAYNEATELPRTLSCLTRAAESQCDFNYEIVVCDNHSSDNTAEIARSYGARVVTESVRQISRSRNAAAEAASGHWLIFLDADTRINRKLLSGVLKKLRSHRFGMVGSVVHFDIEDLDYFPALVVGAWNLISITTGWAAGSLIACKRQAFNEIGGFHTDFYAGEEIDFSLRMHHWCRANDLRYCVELFPGVITSGRKIRNRSTWEMVQQLSILFPGALKSKAACGFWYDDEWRT